MKMGSCAESDECCYLTAASSAVPPLLPPELPRQAGRHRGGRAAGVRDHRGRAACTVYTVSHWAELNIWNTRTEHSKLLYGLTADIVFTGWSGIPGNTVKLSGFTCVGFVKTLLERDE